MQMSSSNFIKEPILNVFHSKKTKKHPDVFRLSIQALVNTAEQNINTSFTVNRMCDEFGFDRRRLYDVINVLCATGCCRKTSIDTIIWNGLADIPTYLKQKYAKGNCDSSPNTDKCISISALASSFMMYFVSYGGQSLDIKQIGLRMSRENNRYKTTLCKLYQIAHILEAATIVERSLVPGEMRLKERFFEEMRQSDIQPEFCDIESLLNRTEILNAVL